jgi:hypothetical protein
MASLVNPQATAGVAPAVEDFLSQMTATIKQAKERLVLAQQTMKQQTYKRRRHLEWKVGDKVLLSTKNLKHLAGDARKLWPKFIGPFDVLQRVGELSYRLNLPEDYKIHDVFHVSLLKPYLDAGPDQDTPPPPLFFSGTPEWEVEHIILV